MNTFLSHPKSGRTWTEIRIALCNEILDLGHSGLPSKYVCLSHGSHHKIDLPLVSSSLIEQSPGEVIVCLREAAAVLWSSFLYLKYMKPWKENHPSWEFKDTVTDAETYIKGPLGIERLIGFYNDLDFSSIKDRYMVVYYEDMFSISSVDWIPKLLEVEEPLTEAQRKFIFQFSDIKFLRQLREGKKYRSPLYKRAAKAVEPWVGQVSQDGLHGHIRVAKPGNHKEAMPPDLQQFIQDYMKKNCTLQEYRQKYIQD